MAKYSLVPYQKEGCPRISIECELNHNQESVYISYKVQGELPAIDLGDGIPHHARVKQLWEKSCFELFIKNTDGQYLEFNFSPTFEWNTFYFAKKGDPLFEFTRMDSVKIDILLSLEVFHLIVEIDKNKFPEGFLKGELQVGISSVIKDTKGKNSYWALSHHDTRPNFHDFRSFERFV